ncbi:MAG: glucokinase [Sphingorhabdus sp.]
MDNQETYHAEQYDLLIAIEGVEAGFALHKPGQGIVAGSIKTYKTNAFPTATDCIQNFAKEAAIRLHGMTCAIAVSGAVSGDSIRIARCPWIISTSGLGYLFGQPVHITNDSAATLWGAVSISPTTHRPIGTYAIPNFDKAGRWLGINFQAGLGAAILISPDGHNLIQVETEAGHCAFNPMDQIEDALHAKLATQKRPVSWERALFAEATDPAWAGTPIFNSQGALLKKRAEILGSFVGDLVLATGTWNGVFLFGQAVSLLGNPEHAQRFSARMETRANFQLPLRAVPRCIVSTSNMIFQGLVRNLEYRRRAKAGLKFQS